MREPVSMNSRDGTAKAWDEFLASSRRGQFQQSSGWADVKAGEGWSAVRDAVSPMEPGAGGFQLLWKPSTLARIGYVSKGPVLPEETETAVDAALESLTRVARSLRLAAVVVQPPDESGISTETLVRHGFFFHPLRTVIHATGIIDLAGGADAVVGRMSRTARQDWRSASRQGVRLRWGAREDLELFFRLMCGSCRRQQAVPNPGRVDLLEALWDAFPDRISLAFARHGDLDRSGLLMIHQGDRIVFWKKGWDSEQPRLFANQFLMTECLTWASEMGFASADLVGMSPEIATRILANEGLTEEQARSRDIFNLRLGARPKLLPPAHFLIVDPTLRRVVYSGLRWKRLRNMLEKQIG